MKILFLDVGGVLNNGRNDSELYSGSRVKQLNKLLEQTDLNIVWITSRLRIDSEELILEDIISFGFKYPKRIIGKITEQNQVWSLSIENYDKMKSGLIKKYLRINKPEYYVILDDDQKIYNKDLNLIVVDNFGITQQIINKIKNQINLKENYETINNGQFKESG